MTAGAVVAVALVKLSVSPAVALVDDPVDVRVTGLAPRAAVTLRATTNDASGRAWRARLVMHADARGVADTHSSMRLFWSILPVRGRNDGFAPPASAAVEVAALRGSRVLAHARVTRLSVSPEVTSRDLDLAHDGLVGTYYAPAPGTPRPAVLALGGSAGGHGGFDSALLASHGYPSLSLAYFKEGGLPPTLKDIPLEYFEHALRWLAAQPGVDATRLVVLGVSRGGEAALLLGTTFPDLVHGVVSCTGSDRVIGAFPGPGFAWTFGGKPVPPEELAVERVAGPVLAFGGGKDEIWESAASVERLVARARAHGRRDVTGVVYRNAGHGIGCIPANLPLTGEYRLSPTTTLEAGGTPAANEAATAASWALVRRFLARL